MASYNKVMLIGNLTRDPELRFIPSGTAVCDMGLAINESFKDKDGTKQDKTVFVDVVAWGNQAETCSEYLSKGSLVMFEGGLQLDQWKTKEGENRTKLRVRASRVQFLGSPGQKKEQQEDPEGVPEYVHEADKPDNDDLPDF